MTSRWRTCPSRPPEARRALITLAWLLLALLLVAPAVAATPSAAVRVLQSEHEYTFSQSLRFALQAESDARITEVILFYGQAGKRLVRRIYPEFTPGSTVDVTHVETLERGQFAPGTTLRYWWRLVTSDGQVTITPEQTFEYTDTAIDWRILAGDRIDLYWYGRDERGAQDLLAQGTEALERLEQEVGVPVSRRVRVYVYNSQADMAPALFSRSEGYEASIITLGVAVDETTLLLLGSHRDSAKTLAHELSHIVVGLAADNPFSDLPRWLDEGLAMYAEGEIPNDNRRALERAVQSDSLLSLRSMTSYSGQANLVDLFYGSAYSVVDFMLDEYGREKLVELLQVFAEGTRQEDALRRVYGLGLDELNNAWRASLGLGPLALPTPAPTHTPLAEADPAVEVIVRPDAPRSLEEFLAAAAGKR